MLKHSLLFLFFLLPAAGLSGQTVRQTGLRGNTPEVFAFTNARIVTEPGRAIDTGTLVVRDGVVVAVGPGISIPADAHVTDLQGKTIYPGFIDIYARYGVPDVGSDASLSDAHWNPMVRSFFQAGDAFRYDEKEAAALRSQGFVMAHAVPSQGIFRGKGAIVSLGEGETSRLLIGRDVSQVLSAELTVSRGGAYPHSSMGAYSLIRQTLYDALWYSQAQQAYRSSAATTARPETNPALEALAADLKARKPFVFELADEQWLSQALALQKEFNMALWLKGSGYEYRRAAGWPALDYPVIVPLNFPGAPDVSTPEATMQLSLEALRHWQLAPENPARLRQKGYIIALTSDGLASKSDFLNKLQAAVKRGLPETDALAALTTTPAHLLGVANHYGTLATGKAASFIVASDNLFASGGEVEQVWIDGKKYQVKPDRYDPRGEWVVDSPATMNGLIVRLEGEPSRLRGSLERGEIKVSLQTVKLDGQRLQLSFNGDSLQLGKTLRLSAHFDGNTLLGIAETSLGEIFSWEASRTGGPAEGSREHKPDPAPPFLPDRYPSMDYGLTQQPEQAEYVLIKNATIWTQGRQGILENYDMMVFRGKIVSIGQSLSPVANALVVDAAGLHVTPGLIDPHLHTSILGNVNETADAITSETRILDVIDGNNVWIYRLLAGGLTTAKLFHGSANPIGGQDAVIKMRWGQSAEELVMAEAVPGLKFALGENVKRLPDRYPNTRMGTEQIIRDAFEAALRYGRQQQAWEQQRRGVPPRRDLQLEPILEVLQGKRMAHVHAYRQDEMLMMMRLAEAYGFRIASFEHTLEGYKIASELKQHGAAAIVWTDWSSFKFEAADGILQNARLLADAGVLTSLHSDNTQLSTRMNWEAAKVMKTGLSDQEAMNLITINPAKILQIDHLTGSLEVGKSADFVIWNGHPLSSFTTAQQTWIEGRKYFDRDDDVKLQQDVQTERAALIQHIMEQQPAAGTGNTRNQ